MAGKKAKELDAEEERPKAEKAGAEGEVKKGTLRAKAPKGKAHCSREPPESQDLAETPNRYLSQ